jgi:hypothetical protein
MAKSSTLASSASESAQSLQGRTESSGRPAAARTSYDSQLEQGGIVASNATSSLKGEDVIVPPLKASLGDRQSGQEAEPDGRGLIGVEEVKLGKSKEDWTEAEFVHLRKAQKTPPRTTKPQERIETVSSEACINFAGQEPGIAEGRQGGQAGDRSEIGNCEAWCCSCGMIGAFPRGKCAHCESKFCSSCIELG